MSKRCPSCVKWIKIRGLNPNTGEEVDGFQCSDVAQFLGTLEVSQQVRQGAAATESMRNTVAKAVTTNVIIGERAYPDLKLIGNT